MAWNVAKNLSIGTSHLSKGGSCADFVEVYQENDLTIAVLSDGVGSLDFSDTASRTVVNEVISIFQTQFSEVYFSSNPGNIILQRCRSALNQTAVIKNLPVDKMDCTLLFAAIFKEKIILGQLGDGAVCLLDNYAGRLLCFPQKGKYANETMTVLSSGAFDSIYIERVDEISAKEIKSIILTSDGLESELYYPESLEVRKISKFYAELVSQESRGSSENLIDLRIKKVQAAGYLDDMSIAVLSRPGHKFQLPENPTWKCSCGYHNPVATDRCSNCSKDFIDVYKKIDFTGIDRVTYFRDLNKKPMSEVPQTNPVVFTNSVSTLTEPPNSKTTPSVGHEPKRTIPRPKGRTVMVRKPGQDSQQNMVLPLAFLMIFCTSLILVANAFISITIRPKIDYEELARITYQIDREESSDQEVVIIPTSTEYIKEDEYSIDVESYRDLITNLINTYGEDGLLLSYSDKAIIALRKSFTGDIYVGEFNGKEADGNGTLFLLDGSILIGTFDDGLKEGAFLVIDSEGNFSTVEYSNDEMLEERIHDD
jgi:serine/threonine protein phosphatase PrpC